MFLEVMTWPKAGFDDRAIPGPLPDLARLAKLIEAKLAAAPPGSSFLIQDEFAADSAYSLVLEVREDEFDPATADPLLSAGDASHLDP